VVGGVGDGGVGVGGEGATGENSQYLLPRNFTQLQLGAAMHWYWVMEAASQLTGTVGEAVTGLRVGDGVTG
jgi:hypothetical protein